MKEREVRTLAKGFYFRGQVLRGTVVETHISWVILTRQYAFKIKRPLRLSFLDFSSLSRRKEYCERELVLNRRFSDIYLEVAPLRQARGKWSVGDGDGRIVDYTVVMKRLQSSKRMDKLLHANRVTPQNVIALAKVVAVHHAGAEIVASRFDPEAMRLAFNDLNTIRPFVAESAGVRYGELIEQSLRWSDAFVRKYHDRFAERVAQGYKRDLHGDLHSGNIFLYATPVLFDCIEFNDAFRRLDVMDEVAFLCMDMESFDRPALSRVFLDRYLNHFPVVKTADDRALYSYYKCYRANVRAKVHAIAARQEDVVAEREAHLQRTVKYLTLMRQYMK